MQKSIVRIMCVFHENNLLMLPSGYVDFNKSDMVLSWNYIITINTHTEYLKAHVKIPFDKLLSDIKAKSLVIIVDGISFNSDQQRKLIEINKNVCFGCASRNDIIDGWNKDNFRKLLPVNVSKFVIVHVGCRPFTDFDFREFMCLQNIYKCAVTIQQCASDKIIYQLSDYDKYDESTFKLPYGCTIEILDDFNKLMS